MQVEIWSDFVCPWCYIGKARFGKALAAFEHRDEVQVAWRAFELDPRRDAVSHESVVDMLASKYGMGRDEAAERDAYVRRLAAQEGLPMHAERLLGNTRDAHRLMHLARRVGQEDALGDRLFAAHFADGQALGSREVLLEAAVRAGIAPGEAAAVLADRTFDDEVLQEERQARAFGANGVPFFVFDRRFAVSGAQATEVFLAALRQAWAAAPAV